MNNELYHYGVLGMKWGVRKKNYRSTSVRSAIARRSNAKVDKSFDKWKEGAKNRDDAISVGKKANAARMAWENDSKNKSLKADYKSAKKEYKKALSKNTTYRKGTVRQEVGKDLSRKYLSKAKKIEKQLKKDPNNKALQKQYTSAMNRHDIQRAKARRAQSVGAKRSQYKAGLKRAATMSIKAAVIGAGVAVAANKVSQYSDVHIDSPEFRSAVKSGLRFVQYIY